MTPQEAFDDGMRLDQYSRLDHGREHNKNIDEFKRLCVGRIARTVPDGASPVTCHDLALVLGAIYAENIGYSMNHDAQRTAISAARAIEALGGKVLGQGL